MADLYRIIWGQPREEQGSSRYFFDNSRRGDADFMYCIQRTLSGRAFFEWQGQRRYVPAGYAMVFCHKEDSSYGYPQGDTEPYVHAFMNFEGPEAAYWLRKVRERFGGLLPMPGGAETTRLFMECVRRFGERGFRDRYQESAMIYELLMAFQSQALSAHQDRDPVLAAHEFIVGNFGMPITVAEVSRFCGLSREHLSRAYASRYGRSPGQALRALRLSSAAELLRGTRVSVEQIAARCGYRDPDGFARAFAQEYGCKPLAYRQQALER